jgi:hypothetical protein
VCHMAQARIACGGRGMQRAIESMGGRSMERVWIFADWKLPDAADLQLIRDLAFTDVVLGLTATSESAAFRPKYSPARVRQCAQRLAALGVRVHVMAWIRRERRFIRECGAWMTATCAETGASTGLLDAEMDWHEGSVSAAEASKLVATEFAGMRCPLGVTGLSSLHATVRPLLDACAYGLPQAYSIWKPGAGKHWSRDPSTEPYRQQLASFASWKAAEKPLVMGLSNYWAARPSRRNEPAMGAERSLQEALRGAAEAGAEEVAFWSLKWLKGNGADRRTARQVTLSIRSTPSPTPRPTSPSADPDPRAEAVQWLLVRLGYGLGKTGSAKDGVDGGWGARSQKALDAFRAAHGLTSRGRFALEDVTALVNAVRKA